MVRVAASIQLIRGGEELKGVTVVVTEEGPFPAIITWPPELGPAAPARPAPSVAPTAPSVPKGALKEKDFGQ